VLSRTGGYHIAVCVSKSLAKPALCLHFAVRRRARPRGCRSLYQFACALRQKGCIFIGWILLISELQILMLSASKSLLSPSPLTAMAIRPPPHAPTNYATPHRRTSPFCSVTRAAPSSFTATTAVSLPPSPKKVWSPLVTFLFDSVKNLNFCFVL
jgi:hypothetical protein